MSLQNPNLKRDKSCFGSSLAAHAELQRLHLIFMLHTNSKNPSNTDTNTSSKPLFAFKPRQVLLAEHNRRSNMAACASKEEKSSKITPVTPEIKAILHESILHYLHRNGFSKSLKRFQSEAQIQGDTWKASSLRLEDIFCKYNASNADTNSNTNKKPKLGNNEATNEETMSKKKKKKGIVESDNGAIEDQSKVTDKMTVESNKKFDQISEDIVVNEPGTKLKKKKKTKLDSGSSGQVEETKPDLLKNGSLDIDDLKKKSKDKKKKIIIQQDKSEPSTINSNESETEVAHKQKKKKEKKKLNTGSVEDEGVQPDVTKKEKSCKKRKRSGSDENDDLPTDAIIIEQSKCQKKEQKSKKEGSEVNEIDTQEMSNKGVDGQENGKPEINGGEKSGSQKSAEKQQNGLAEPKTVNAFQRVKIDQVEFAHEKLQDNSYWAKDGAEIGYGAKAQEVLGQVRGRDFRHEKTKKKRGSYRGGLIDLESRSVKFDYSEEE